MIDILERWRKRRKRAISAPQPPRDDECIAVFFETPSDDELVDIKRQLERDARRRAVIRQLIEFSWYALSTEALERVLALAQESRKDAE